MAGKVGNKVKNPKRPGTTLGTIRGTQAGKAHKWERSAESSGRPLLPPVLTQDCLAAITLHISTWRRHSIRATLSPEHTTHQRVWDSYLVWCESKEIEPVSRPLLLMILGSSTSYDSQGFYLTLIS